MRRPENARYFELSTLLAIGVGILLLISIPGGCGEDIDENGDPDVEAGAEPTAPPMMEIVEPEPGNAQPEAPPENEQSERDDQQGDETQPEESGEQNGEPGSYVVQPGDTLYAIAVQFNISVDALMEANGITDPNSLQVGQILRIPR